MSDDLVERVARAICKADGRYDYSQWARELRPVARAAIASIDAAGYVVVPREPTEKMMVAVREWKGQQSYDDIWHAMIDAAQKDKANGG